MIQPPTVGLRFGWMLRTIAPLNHEPRNGSRTMTEQDRYQLQGAAARVYEAQKVPSMFRPLAKATLEQIDVPAGAKVLDVACGTGIVARLVSE